MPRKVDANLNVLLSTTDKLSAPVAAVASNVKSAASKMVGSDKDLIASAEKLARTKSGQLSASRDLAFQIRKEAAAGNKLETELVDLDRKHAELTVKMRSLLKAGQQVPPNMLRQAAAAKRQAAALRESKRATQALTTMFSGLKAMLGPAALLGTILQVTRAMTRMGTDAIKTGDDLAKLSQRVGVSVEAIQELRFAAASAGVEQASLDKALKMLGKSAGEAALGTATYRDAFEALGVEIKDGDGKLRDIDDLLSDVADGLKNTSSQSEKLMLAQRLLGRSGADLINMLQDGSVALEEMREQKRRLGLMSTEAAANAETLTQSITELDERSVRLSNAFNERVVPSLTGIVNGFGDLMDLINENSAAFETYARVSLAVVTLGMSELGISAVKLAGEMGGMADTTDESAESTRDLGAAADETTIKIKGLDIEIKTLKTREKEAATARKQQIADEKAARDALSVALAGDAAARALGAPLIAAEIIKTEELTARLGGLKAEYVDLSVIAGIKTAEALGKSAAAADTFVQAGKQSALVWGAALGSIAANSDDAGQKITAATMSTARAAISAASSKAAIESIAAYSGIPVIGLVLGLAAAGAALAAINTFALGKFHEGGRVRGNPGGDVIFAAKDGEAVFTERQTDAVEKLGIMLETVLSRPVVPAGVGRGGSGGDTFVFQMLELPSEARARQFAQKLAPQLRRARARGY